MSAFPTRNDRAWAKRPFRCRAGKARFDPLAAIPQRLRNRLIAISGLSSTRLKQPMGFSGRLRLDQSPIAPPEDDPIRSSASVVI
jgi:hypothetical protein